MHNVRREELLKRLIEVTSRDDFLQIVLAYERIAELEAQVAALKTPVAVTDHGEAGWTKGKQG